MNSGAKKQAVSMMCNADAMMAVAERGPVAVGQSVEQVRPNVCSGRESVMKWAEVEGQRCWVMLFLEGRRLLFLEDRRVAVGF